MSDDWDFKFDDEEANKKKKKTSESKKIKVAVKDGEQKRVVKNRLAQDDDFEIPKEKSMKILLDRAGAKRKLRREYIEKDVEEEDDETKLAPGDKQITALAIDYTLSVILWLAAPKIIKSLIAAFEIKQQFVGEISSIGPYLLVFSFFVSYNFILPLIFRRTLGMMILKQTLLTEDGDVPSLFTVWMKMIFIQPIMLATVISPLMILVTGRGVSDRILGTITAKD